MIHITRFLVVCSIPFLTAPDFGNCVADDAQQMAIVQDARIAESSGLAVSYTYPGAVWIHNDSGDGPQLFLVGLDGETKAVVKVLDAKAHDWEDMCSFKIGDQSWLLIGDIGDNQRQRGDKQPDCCLYLLKEPVIPPSNGLPTFSWSVTATIRFRYEDKAWDCEGLAVDSERKEILLLTKGLPRKCGLYVMPLDLNDRKQKRKAKRIASPFILYATALDISPSGRTMVVGSMINGLSVTRQAEQSWADAFKARGTAFALPPRRQGETICFDQTGQWLYLNSESPQQPLWRMRPPR